MVAGVRHMLETGVDTGVGNSGYWAWWWGSGCCMTIMSWGGSMQGGVVAIGE